MKPMSPIAWWQLGYDAWQLGVESSTVVGLRSLRMMAGGATADSEARLMVSEKMGAAMDLGLHAMTGRLGASPGPAAAKVIAHYRRKVRANQRRLTK